MKTRQATKRNQEVAVHETISNFNNSDSARKKKLRLAETKSQDIAAKPVNDNQKTDVKEELSSDSSSDEFLKVNELDLNSDFFKPLKNNEFQDIEKKIFSEVSRLSDSESALSDDDFEVSQKLSDSRKGRENKPVENKSSTGKSLPSVINEKRRRGNKESVAKPRKKIKQATHKELANSKIGTDEKSVDVSQLLALGEGSSTNNIVSFTANSVKYELDSDDSDDWENVEALDQKTVEHKVPKEGVEITLKFPGMYEKRKKKGFDMQAHMLRRLNRVKREIQVLVHKVHLLCWIAHGRYLNSVINTSELLAVALSLIPSERCYPPKHSNLKYLEHFVTWFSSVVVLNHDPPKNFGSGLSLVKLMEVEFEKKSAISKRDLVLMFVCTLRAVGLKVRLVLSLQPLPLKPPSSELCPLSKAGKHMNSKKKKKKGEGTVDDKQPSGSSETKGKAKSTSGTEVNEAKRSRISKNDSKKSIAVEILRGKSNLSNKNDEKISKHPENTKKKGSTSAAKRLGKDEEELAVSRAKRKSLRVRNSEAKVKYNDSSSEDCEEEGVHEKGSIAGGKSPKLDSGRLQGGDDLQGSSDPKGRVTKKKQLQGKHSSGNESSKGQKPGRCRAGLVREASCPVSGPASDSDFEPSQPSTQRRPSQAQEAPDRRKDRCDVWAEVFLEEEEKWISVDVPRGKIHCVSQIYASATHPVVYVLGFNNDQTLKDVTRRYCPQFHAVTRKLRVDPDWWSSALRGFVGRRTAADRDEDEDMDRQLEDRPLPSTISEYKNHPLYALKRHLLKFEAIYPPDAPPLGFVRGEPVYARECVKNLHSREVWVKEAKVVRLGEQPYKIVKARPKYDRMTGQMKTDLPLEVFGEWQVEDYVPPAAKDGKVPRNEYGNVELFKPCMLPRGTVHLQVPGLNRVAKKLNIDCASAVVGFDFHSGGSHPTYDGFVVCEEFADVLLDAWEKDQEEQEQRQREKVEKRVYGNWKLLIRGLLIRERLKARYSFGKDAGEGTSSGSKGKLKKAKGTGRSSR